MSKSTKKNSEKKTIKNQNNKTRSYIIKSILIVFLLWGLFYANQVSTNQNPIELENTISLLAVSTGSEGEVKDGSIIDLTLQVKNGTGEVYVNQNSLQEIDTQVSIVNSQKIACNLFQLPCEKYDFYYEFSGTSLVLKGPSASSAIAVLVAKTLNGEEIGDDTVITGSLSSGGIIGNVGGVREKAQTAQRYGFETIIVPVFTQENLDNLSINVVKTLDIVEVYNYFAKEDYKLPEVDFEKGSFEDVMKQLSENLCSRAESLMSEISGFKNITNESKNYNYKVQAEDSLNNSKLAAKSGNYYSSGSFCYNANINLRILKVLNENLSVSEIEEKISKVEEDAKSKKSEIVSKDYLMKNVLTINDFYVYLVLNNRVEESLEFIDNYGEATLPDLENVTSNFTKGNISENVSSQEISNILAAQTYAYSLERLNTVSEWEELIIHDGEKVNVNPLEAYEACTKINHEILIKSELLKSYSFFAFNEEINKQIALGENSGDKYLCIYDGLELNARINSVLNSIDITQNDSEQFAELLVNFTETRIPMNSNGDFPLIPYIYYEYSKQLLETGDIGASILYSNYALSYADLNLYLEKEQNFDEKVDTFKDDSRDYFEELFDRPLFVLGIVLLIGFV
ncbi:MAG: S16 family serine protease [Nanoarchaeota archaeon]